MKKKLIALCLLLFTILLLNKGYTLAWYTSNSVWNYYLKSKGFYFESDLGKYVDNNWDGSKVYFNLNNSKNGIGSDYDIKYKASCKTDNGIDCKINGLNEFIGTLSNDNKCINNIDSKDVSLLDKANCEMQGYTFKVVPTKANLSIDLPSSTLSTKVTVTVTSLEPFTKTITGEFILNKNTTINNQVLVKYDKKLILSNTTDLDKCLKVKFDSNKLRVKDDNFINYATDNNGYINEFEIKIKSKDSIIYNFIELESNLNENNFTLEEIKCVGGI